MLLFLCLPFICDDYVLLLLFLLCLCLCFSYILFEERAENLPFGMCQATNDVYVSINNFVRNKKD